MPRRDLEAHRSHLVEHGDNLVRQVLGLVDAAALDVRVDVVHYRPDRDVTVGYEVALDVGGERHEEYLLATTADVSGQVATLDSEEFSFRVWQHPHDPVLVAAPRAFSPEHVAGWLGTAGVASGPVELTALAYRPMRRAVLRADAAEGGRWFVKVQRAKRHREYLERMALLAPAGVTPPVVAVPAEGVTITAAAPGVSLAVALAGWSMRGDAEPDASSLLELLGRFPGGVRTLPQRVGFALRLALAAQSAAVELPARAGEVRALLARLTAADADARLGPVVATHGDFYEANIFTDDGRAVSVIDVETAGPGHLVDDLACLLAHLVVLPDLSPVHYARLPELIERWFDVFAGVVDGGTLRVRVAGLILGLLAGAGESQASLRLDRALEWSP